MSATAPIGIARLNPFNYPKTPLRRNVAITVVAVTAILALTGFLASLAAAGVNLGALNSLSTMTVGGGIHFTVVFTLISVTGLIWFVKKPLAVTPQTLGGEPTGTSRLVTSPLPIRSRRPSSDSSGSFYTPSPSEDEETASYVSAENSPIRIEDYSATTSEGPEPLDADEPYLPLEQLIERRASRFPCQEELLIKTHELLEKWTLKLDQNDLYYVRKKQEIEHAFATLDPFLIQVVKPLIQEKFDAVNAEFVKRGLHPIKYPQTANTVPTVEEAKESLKSDIEGLFQLQDDAHPLKIEHIQHIKIYIHDQEIRIAEIYGIEVFHDFQDLDQLDEIWNLIAILVDSDEPRINNKIQMINQITGKLQATHDAIWEKYPVIQTRMRMDFMIGFSRKFFANYIFNRHNREDMLLYNQFTQAYLGLLLKLGEPNPPLPRIVNYTGDDEELAFALQA